MQDQIVTLAVGQNWWSTNLDITLGDLKAAIADVLGATGTATIKSQNGSVNYSGGRWRGDIDFDIRKMYKIYVSAACEITLTGIPVNSADYEITISNGSNWIGFPCGESMSVGTALSGLNPENGDIIKSMEGSSSFQGTSWRGPLQTLEPGHGYIYQSKASGDKTFTFPANAK